MKDPISPMEWHPGPGAEELVRRKAQLLVLSQQLLDRERGLAAFRNELHAFETSYRKALGARYARLDELAERLDETAIGDDPGAARGRRRRPGRALPRPGRARRAELGLGGARAGQGAGASGR